MKTVSTPELNFVPSGDVLKGDLLAAKYFARLQSDLGLYGSDAYTTTEVSLGTNSASFNHCFESVL